jgi:tetratricopeptide (TPR) repeat protein
MVGKDSISSRNAAGDGKSAWYFLAFLLVIAVWSLHNVNFYALPHLADCGERLFYPSITDILDSSHMPAAAVIHALSVRSIFGFSLSRALPLLAACLCIAQVFSLAESLFSPIPAFVSGLAAICLCRSPYCDLEQLVYSFTILTLAGLLVRDFGSRRNKDIAVGLAAGATVLVKSVLVPFPAAYLLFTLGKDDSWRVILRRAALLFSGIILVAAIWGAVIHADSGAFTFLDQSRASSNIITGALGLTGTAEGDYRALAGITQRDSASAWAATEIIMHPLRYAVGVIRRIGFILMLHPLLLFLASGGFLYCRRRVAAAQPALLAAFFLLAHCIMTVEPRYLVPFWFLCAPFASGLVGLLLAQPDEKIPGATAGWVTPICAISTGLLSIISLFLVLRFPCVAKTSDGYESVIKNNPGNDWLKARYASALIDRGESASAVQIMSGMNSFTQETLLIYGSALLTEHDILPESELIKQLPPTEGAAPVFITACLESGNYRLANTMLNKYVQRMSYIRFASGNYELGMQEQLRARSGKDMLRLLAELMEPMPFDRMSRIAARLHNIGFDAKEAMDDTYIVRWLHARVPAYPPELVAIANAGVTEARAGNLTQAEKTLTQVVETDNRYLPAYASLAAIYIKENRTAALLEINKKAMRFNPKLRNYSLLDMVQPDTRRYSYLTMADATPDALRYELPPGYLQDYIAALVATAPRSGEDWETLKAMLSRSRSYGGFNMLSLMLMQLQRGEYGPARATFATYAAQADFMRSLDAAGKNNLPVATCMINHILTRLTPEQANALQSRLRKIGILSGK